MIGSKYATKIACIAMAAAVLVCMLALAFPQELVEAVGGTGIAMEYEAGLFGTDAVIQIDIQMEQEEWEDMLANAMAEEYYPCDVVIQGEKIENVGIRPKGNTSLSSIASDPNTDRFSLKLEFDHYVEGQTCLGLDKLILNNNYADATNMKEAIIYDMYQYLGADASLWNYAEISVNGTYWGVYLALEAVEESFLRRNYGVEDGKLYKPEGMSMGNGPGGEAADFPERNPGDQDNQKPPEMKDMPGEGSFSKEKLFGQPEGTPESQSKVIQESMDDMTGSMPQPSKDNMKDMPEFPENQQGNPPQFPPNGGENMPDHFPGSEDQEGPPQMRDMPDGGAFSREGMPGGGFSMNSGGANLNYTDDNLDSYSVIWDGEVTDSGKKDHKRVVKALKNISQGTELEKYLDIDNVLKYMAVHTFSVNLDSLSGTMAHNYYLYEYDGKLNIIPWDYNLSFGGMGMGGSNASDMINDAIDTPFQGTEFFDALLEDQGYLEKYHEYLKKLVEEYVFGGGFEDTYQRIRNQIDKLVESDPTAFYSYEEYTIGAEMLYQTVLLRAESIQGQLDGRIPATDAGQRTDPSSLIDASAIDIETMGVFDRGKKQFTN